MIQRLPVRRNWENRQVSRKLCGARLPAEPLLSPLSNQRTDAWGGLLENRARLLFEIVKAVAARFRPDSGSCRRFELRRLSAWRPADDARQVVKLLNETGR
ncbi:oxidoreductase [Cupriavidus basilensis]